MKRWFAVSFDAAEPLLAAVARAGERGWRVIDAHTPCPVHGLEHALGLPKSRLPWLGLACGLAGALFMTWFQHWTSAVDWRLNVGGRPWNSSLSFACATFEVTVLAAGLGAVVAFFARSRRYPGRLANAFAAGLTDDRFALIVEETDQRLEPAIVAAAMADLRPCEVREIIVEDRP